MPTGHVVYKILNYKVLYFPSFYSDLGDISIYTVLTDIYAKRIDRVELSLKKV